MTANAKNLLWLDLEMTGLDPDRERIIEIATIVTDKDLVVLAEGPDLVIHQTNELLAGMDDWNRKHHGKSGLTAAVVASVLTTEDAETQTLDFVKQHCPVGLCPLAGNSIHMDREFLRRYMPRLHEWVHYRNVDVSTFKELATRWAPEKYAERPKKEGDHRALGDVVDSINELRFYRDALFRVG